MYTKFCVINSTGGTFISNRLLGLTRVEPCYLLLVLTQGVPPLHILLCKDRCMLRMKLWRLHVHQSFGLFWSGRSTSLKKRLLVSVFILALYSVLRLISLCSEQIRKSADFAFLSVTAPASLL